MGRLHPALTTGITEKIARPLPVQFARALGNHRLTAVALSGQRSLHRGSDENFLIYKIAKSALHRKNRKSARQRFDKCSAPERLTVSKIGNH